MKEFDLVKQMNDGKLVGIAENLLVPMLHQHLEDELQHMCHKFNEGDTMFAPNVAKINYIRTLLSEFDLIKKKGERAAEKIMHQGDNQ